MCWQDIQIARSTRSRQINLTSVNTSFQVLPYNPLRFAIYFLTPETGTVTVGQTSAMQTGRGILCASASLPPWVNLVLHGDMVKQPWYAIGSAATARWGLIEVELAGMADDQT